MTHLLQQAIQGSDEPHAPSRRSIILAGGAIFGWAMLPKITSAAGARDPRFITIVLRGALDGLTAVPPIGDPAYANMRGALALTRAVSLREQPLRHGHGVGTIGVADHDRRQGGWLQRAGG